MRLAQLARKVGRNQQEIVKFLSVNGLIVEDASNTKIGEDEARLVINHFAPQLFETSIAIQSPVIEPVMETAQADTIVNDMEAEGTVMPLNTDQRVELIKAPKIELQGLKVLGKIELNEVKKKSVEKEPPPLPSTKREDDKSKSRSSRAPKKNPITVQREREERERQQKKLEKAAYLKELKTQRYLNKVRRPIDLYKEPKKIVPEEEPKKMKKEEQRASSFFSRLFNWFGKK